MKVEWVSLVMTGLLLGLLSSACRERNPAYIQGSSLYDASVSKDAMLLPDGPAKDTKIEDMGAFLPDALWAEAGDSNVEFKDSESDSKLGTVDEGGRFDAAYADVRDTRGTRDVREGDVGFPPPLDAPLEDGALADGAEDMPASPDGVLDVPALPDRAADVSASLDGAVDAPASLDGGVVDVGEGDVVIVFDVAAVDVILGLPGDGGGQPMDGGVSCKDLENQYTDALPAAQRCDVNTSGQCQQLVSSSLSPCLTCTTYVNDATALTAITTSWEQAGCNSSVGIICPAIACIQPNAGVCTAVDGGSGTCNTLAGTPVTSTN